MTDLFSPPPDPTGRTAPEVISRGAVLFRGYALPLADNLMAAIDAVTVEAPFRRMKTPGGRSMSVAMTGCGKVSWVTDSRGYRYSETDPETGRTWPVMPDEFRGLAIDVAGHAGYAGFEPDVCLINRYESGARMGLHQDRDEKDFRWPVVSVSLGVSATFLWGGLNRGGRPARLALDHGDVLVWGGEDRLRYHGIAPLKAEPMKASPIKNGRCEATGHLRYNLTFRRAR